MRRKRAREATRVPPTASAARHIRDFAVTRICANDEHAAETPATVSPVFGHRFTGRWKVDHRGTVFDDGSLSVFARDLVTAIENVPEQLID
jgi:hypothetical protein